MKRIHLFIITLFGVFLFLFFFVDPTLAQTPTVVQSPTPWPTMEIPANCLWKTIGDADCDEDVDEQDYIRWVCELIGEGRCQTSPSGPEFWRSADFDLVDNVTINDFEIWRRHDITINPVAPTSTTSPVPPTNTPTLTPTNTPTPTPISCNCSPGNFPCCIDSFYNDRCADPNINPDATCGICDTQCRNLDCCDLLTPTPTNTPTPTPISCNCSPGNFPCCIDSFYNDRCADPNINPDATCGICDTQCRDLGCCDL